MGKVRKKQEQMSDATSNIQVDGDFSSLFDICSTQILGHVSQTVSPSDFADPVELRMPVAKKAARASPLGPYFCQSA